MKKSAKKLEHEEVGSHGHAHSELGKLEGHAMKRPHHSDGY